MASCGTGIEPARGISSRLMDVGAALAPLYDPLMRIVGWTRTQRGVLTGAEGSILDVGCGPARLANGSHEHYVGVDRRMAMLSQGPGGTTLVCADAAALPFGDGTFDTVVSTALLGLCLPAERRPILREMARVCRGTLRILEPIAPLDPVRRAVALSRQPVRLEELRTAGWHVTCVGQDNFAGVYTLVCATPTVRPASNP